MKLNKMILTILVVLLSGTSCKKEDNDPLYLSSTKRIIAFNFLKTDNPSLPLDIFATIDHEAKIVNLVVPHGIALNGLNPHIELSPAASTDMNGVQDFTNPKRYKIRAEDGTTVTYEVTVIVASNNEKRILYFNFFAEDNTELTRNYEGIINEELKSIRVTFPGLTDLSEMTPTIGVSPGATINPDGAQNFTDIVTYKITAEDGTFHTYEVKLTNIVTKQKTVLADIINNNPENTLGWDLSTTEIGSLAGLNTRVTGEIYGLNLSGKGINIIPSSIGELENLTFLNLSNNNIEYIPEDIASLTYLSSFYIDNNMLNVLPDALWTLTELRNLGLNGNNLSSIPKEIGALLNLRQFDVSKNKVLLVPTEIGQLTALTYFNIASNEITALPDEVGQLINLQYFYVGDNQLSNLPTSIRDLSNIEYLSISNNNFSTLPNEIEQLTTLIELNISYNTINTLPATMAELINLEELDLRGNSYFSIPQAICDLDSIHGTVIYKDDVVTCD